MKLFNNILCCFLGHKADKHKHMLAYSIESYPMSYEVNIYDIANVLVVVMFIRKASLKPIIVMTGI